MRLAWSACPNPVWDNACINAPSVFEGGSPMRGVPSQSLLGNGGPSSGDGRARPLPVESGAVFADESDVDVVWAEVNVGARPARTPTASTVPSVDRAEFI